MLLLLLLLALLATTPPTLRTSGMEESSSAAVEDDDSAGVSAGDKRGSLKLTTTSSRLTPAVANESEVLHCGRGAPWDLRDPDSMGRLPANGRGCSC